MPNLFGFRKFIIAFGFLLASTGLCALGKLSGGEFVGVAGLVTGLFGAANVAPRFAAGGAAK